MSTPIPPGSRLGRYEIRAKIGKGGMGEVYLARDTILDRKVALKILPAEVASNQERMRRFVQEAKAAAALNHPNIAHIYEIAEADGVHFIAMEFIDGHTLRKLIHSEPVELAKLLRYLQHAAGGLAKAHAAGIAHRDLKPDNIMVTRDGHAKILDFGLVKLIEPAKRGTSDAGSELETPTLQRPQSTPGTILGTVGYMSPEQAQGKTKEIDHRSDVFSFGCILFEAVTRKKAFEGQDTIDCLNKIIREPVAPITDFVPEAPAELQKIVRRCLAKDPEERYQSIKDVAIELKDVRRELTESLASNTTTPALAQTESRNASDTQPPSGTAGAGSEPRAWLSTGVSSSESVNNVKSFKTATVLALVAVIVFSLVAVIVTAALGYALYRSAFQKKPAVSFQSAKFTRLTNTGKVTDAAISPDGKWLVHVVDDGGQQSLWLGQVAIANSNTQIVAPSAIHFTGEAFSPDGNYVYYSVEEEKGTLYQVPVLGGIARKLLTGVDSSVAFSPDGKQIAFFRYTDGADRIVIANADGTAERQLAMRSGHEYFFLGGLSRGLSWAPDGKTLASAIGNLAENYMTIVTVSVESGEIGFFSPRKWFQVRQLAWLNHGSILVSAREPSGFFRIWQVAYPLGEAQALTNDLDAYTNISLTADGRVLATIQEDAMANIWVMPGFDATQARKITQGRSLDNALSWTPDGRIVYASKASINYDLYLVNPRESYSRQLTVNAGLNTSPCVSADGRYIFFVSGRTGMMRIWRMNADGGDVKQFTANAGFSPSCSPKDQWLVFQSGAPETIWKMSTEGGQPAQVTQTTSYSAFVSPDGNQLAYLYYQEDPTSSSIKLAIISSDGGPPVKTLEVPNTLESNMRWSPDGRAIVYPLTMAGVSNLWAKPLEGGPPKQLTTFTSDRIFWFEFSRDGKQIALSRGSRVSDVVLISSFRP